MLKLVLFFLFVLFFSFHLQKEEDFSKKKEGKETQKKTTFLALKTGPGLLRNILGPVFNASLDQFLTLGFLFFFVLFFFFLAETPIFIVFQQQMQNLKKHKKEIKTLFVSTPVLTALVKMSFFCAFFIFGFFAISNFFRDVF